MKLLLPILDSLLYHNTFIEIHMHEKTRSVYIIKINIPPTISLSYSVATSYINIY